MLKLECLCACVAVSEGLRGRGTVCQVCVDEWLLWCVCVHGLCVCVCVCV